MGINLEKMNYEQRYKEALERAEILIEKLESNHIKGFIYHIFPELKESEDERIRKTLMVYIHDFGVPKEYFGNLETSNVIAWLEKQGDKSQGKTALEAIHEEKVDNAIKVEPTFNVGDWITFYGDKPFKILKVESEQNDILDYLLLSQNGHDSYYNKKYVDENARLWTIQDAKDGDVLVSGDVIFIFNKIHGVWVNCYCSLHKDGSFCEENYDLMHIKYAETIYPSTKEQRDTLFAKMKEAGYEWDTENKCLTKI